MVSSRPQRGEIPVRKQRDDRPFDLCCGFLPHSTHRILPTLCYERPVARERIILTQSAINANEKPLGARLWDGAVLIPLISTIIPVMESRPYRCSPKCNT